MDELAARNVALFLDGDRLRFRAPAGAITAELRAAIQASRDAVIAHLQMRPASAPQCVSCDARDWIDEPSANGRIRTHCRRCGRFIGYRPVTPF